MMRAAYISLVVEGFFYLLAAVFYGLAFFRGNARLERHAFFLIRVGFLAASIYLGLEAFSYGFAFPILNFSHVIAFFSWALAFLYLIPLQRIQAQSFGFILAPVLFILSFVAVLHANDPTYRLQVSIYFALHIIFAFLAYAALTLSFAAAILYLIQHRELKKRNPGAFYHRLPNLETLDSLFYIPMIIGLILLAGAVIVGLFWAKETYGQFWMNDPKTWLTLMTLVLYGALVFLRFGAQTRKSRLALMGLLIFVFMIVSFAGGRQFSKGNHRAAVSANSAFHPVGEGATL